MTTQTQLEQKVLSILSKAKKRTFNDEVKEKAVIFEERLVMDYFITHIKDSTLSNLLGNFDIRDIIIADYFMPDYANEVLISFRNKKDIVRDLKSAAIPKPDMSKKVDGTPANSSMTSAVMGYCCLLNNPQSEELAAHARCIDELKLTIYIDELIDKKSYESPIRADSIHKIAEELSRIPFDERSDQKKHGFKDMDIGLTSVQDPQTHYPIVADAIKTSSPESSDCNNTCKVQAFPYIKREKNPVNHPLINLSVAALSMVLLVVCSLNKDTHLPKDRYIHTQTTHQSVDKPLSYQNPMLFSTIQAKNDSSVIESDQSKTQIDASLTKTTHEEHAYKIAKREKSIAQTIKISKETNSTIEDILKITTPDYIIYSNKQDRLTTLYKIEGQKYSRIGEFRHTAGKTKGNKIRNGDGRTPESIFKIIHKSSRYEGNLNKSRFYDTARILLDFPNMIDRKRGITGKNKGMVICDSNNRDWAIDRGLDVTNEAVVLKDKDMSILYNTIKNNTALAVIEHPSRPLDVELYRQYLQE
jgi:hypothetical protein